MDVWSKPPRGQGTGEVLKWEKLEKYPTTKPDSSFQHDVVLLLHLNVHLPFQRVQKKSLNIYISNFPCSGSPILLLRKRAPGSGIEDPPTERNNLERISPKQESGSLIR